MKRLFCLVFVVILAVPCSFSAFAESDDEPIFGLMLDGAVLLDEDYEPICSLPSSYFVEVKGEAGAYFAVNYRYLNGFLAKEFVEVVDYEPRFKVHSGVFEAKNDTFPTNIRVSPNSDSAVLTSIPLNESGFLYGFIEGEALIEGAGNVWCFVEFEGVRGYCYLPQGIAQPIEPNVIEKVIKPIDFSVEAGGEFEYYWLVGIFLAVICVVSFVLLFSKKGFAKDI